MVSSLVFLAAERPSGDGSVTAAAARPMHLARGATLRLGRGQFPPAGRRFWEQAIPGRPSS